MDMYSIILEAARRSGRVYHCLPRKCRVRRDIIRGARDPRRATIAPFFRPVNLQLLIFDFYHTFL